jgi:hypothetical protein
MCKSTNDSSSNAEPMLPKRNPTGTLGPDKGEAKKWQWIKVQNKSLNRTSQKPIK